MKSILKRLTQKQKVQLIVTVGIMLISSLIIFYAVSVEKPFGEGYKTVDQYGGDFSLSGPNGEVNLRDFRGKVVVGYFGFLSCTVACPQAMAIGKAAIRRLTEEEKQKVQILFISVDPERDKPEELRDFATYFDRLLAITGTRKQIDDITNNYGVFYELIELEGSALNYTIDHSSRFYMIDQNGKLETTMSHSTTPTELAAMIRQMQANNPN